MKLLRVVVVVVALWLVWKYIVSEWVDIDYSLPFFGQGSVEGYLDYSRYTGYEPTVCEPAMSADKDCHDMAMRMCDVTDDRLNGCWLPSYRKCLASAPNDLVRTNCHRYANAYCGGHMMGNVGECAECYGKTHNMCMAKKGVASAVSCTY